VFLLQKVKRNCPQFLEDKNNENVLSSSGILVIEINLATFISDWVLDTGSCAHICSNMQALKNKRLLGKGEMQLRIGNGASVAVVAVGDSDFHLPSGLILELSSVYFVPSISRKFISVSCMDMDDFTFFFIKDQCFSFYRDGIFYGSSHIVNGLYVLEMDNQVLNINNKRLKSSRESETLIWHHRLGHINETHIKKLQEVGLLG
jgi:GAG-pre-integrase domain